MITAQLIEMLQTQDRMNCIVHPDWINQNYNWSRAAYVESAELLEQVGWKWWKKQDIDVVQVHLELVDIWHFILSNTLVEFEGRIQPAALHLLEAWEEPISRVFVSDGAGINTCVADLSIQTRIQVFGSLAGLTGEMMPSMFRNICDELKLTSSRMYTLYIQKNVLNEFRQDHGYKEGTYQKFWSGQEDNVVLAQIAQELKHVTRDSLYQALSERYPGA